MIQTEYLLLGPSAMLFFLNVAVVVVVATRAGLLSVQICRRRSAPVRYGILLCTLMFVLCAPAVVLVAAIAGLGWVRVEVAPAVAAAAPPGRMAPVESRPAGDESPAKERPENLEPAAGPIHLPAPRSPHGADFEYGESSPEGLSVEDEDFQRYGSVEQPPESTTESDASFDVSTSGEAVRAPRWLVAANLLAIVWAAGSALGLFLLARGLIRLVRFRRGLRERPSDRVARAAARLAPQVGLSQPPRIFVSPRTSAPLVLGLRAPVILLPDGFEEESLPHEIDVVLLHEMAHLARGDQWAGLGQRFAEALFWWCPLVYAVNRRLCRLREHICDNYVLRSQGDGSQFAEMLVALAERAASTPGLPATTGLFDARERELEERIKRLLCDETNTMVRTNAKTRLLFAAFATALVGTTLLLTVQADETAPPKGEKNDRSDAWVQTHGPQRDAGPRLDHFGDPLPDAAVARLGTSRLRYRGVSLSPDGKTLAWLGQRDQDIHVWDVVAGKELRSFTSDGCRTVKFSPDGKWLAVGGQQLRLWDIGAWREASQFQDARGGSGGVSFSTDGEIMATVGGPAGTPGGWENAFTLWQVRTGKQLLRLQLKNALARSIAMAPDGKMVAVGGWSAHGCPICIFDVAAGRQIRRFEQRGDDEQGGIDALTYSPDGESLAWRGDGNSLFVANASTGRERIRIKNVGRSLAFSPDGKRIAARSLRDGAVRLWDAATGKELKRLETAGEPVGFSRDGKSLVVAAGGELSQWDVAKGIPLVQHRFNGHNHGLLCAVVSPDGNTIATSGHDHTIRLWNANTGRQRRRLDGHGHWVRTIAFSPDGRILASGSHDGTLRLWDTATDKETRRFAELGGEVFSLAFAPDGATLAASIRDALRIWHVASGKQIRQIEGMKDLYTIAFSHDGKRLATSEAGRIRLWDIAAGKEVKRFEFEKKEFSKGNACHFARFSPDDKTLFALRYDGGSMLAFDTKTGKRLHQLDSVKGANCLAVSPHGKTLAAGHGDEVRLWDIASGKLLETLTGHQSTVHFVSYSRDGRRLVSASADGTALVFSALRRTAVVRKEFRHTSGHGRPVGANVAFSPDGAILASASTGGGVRLWDLASGRELLQVKGAEGEIATIHHVAFSPDGKFFATGGEQITVWNIQGQRIRTLDPGDIYTYSLVFLPDGKTLVTATDVVIHHWDLASGRLLKEIQYPKQVLALHYSRDGKLLVERGDKTLRDLASGRIVSRVEWDIVDGGGSPFSADGGTFVEPIPDGEGQIVFRLRDTKTRQELRRFSGFRGRVGGIAGMAISRDGRRFAAADESGRIVVWVVGVPDRHGKKKEARAQAPPAAIQQNALTDEVSGAPMRRLMHTTARGQRNRHTSVTFSPDGKRLVSASNEGTIRLWDAASGRELRMFRGHEGDENTVYSVALSPDGRMLASGGYRVVLMDAATGRAIRTLEDVDRPLMSLSFSPDGKSLAGSDGDDTLYLFDVASGKVRKRLNCPGVVAIHYSREGRLLVAREKQNRRPSGVPQRDLLTVPGGWEILDQGSPYSPDAGQYVQPVVEPSTHRVTFQLRDAKSDQTIRRFTGHRGKTSGVAVSKDGRRFAAADDKGQILIWFTDLAQLPNPDARVAPPGAGAARVVAEEIIRLRHAGGRSSIGFSPDGKLFATVVGYQKVVLWDVAARKQLRQIHVGERKVFRIAFSPDGKTLATGGIMGEGAVRMWEAATGKLLRVLPGAQNRAVLSLAFSSDGKILAAAKGNTITLWDVTGEARKLREIQARGAVDSLSFSPGGKLLATVSGGSTVELWDVETGREIRRLEAKPTRFFGSQAVAFSPDGKTLATAGEDRKIRLWEVKSGKRISQFGPENGQAAFAIAYAPDGKTLLSGHGDAARLWETASGKQLRQWEGPAMTAAFSRDGKTLAFGDATGTTLVRLDIPGLLKRP